MEILLGSPVKIKTAREVGIEAKMPNWLLQIIKSSSKHIDDYGNLVFIDSGDDDNDDASVTKASMHHQNLAGYLEGCSQLQAGAVMRPDIFYFTVVNEISNAILANTGPASFVVSNKRAGGEGVVDAWKCGDLWPVFETLLAKISKGPSWRCGDLLTPAFTTDNNISKEARLACFAEEASTPNYGQTVTSFTAIKKIRLEGTEEDWAQVVDLIKKWLEIVDTPKTLIDYLAIVLKIAEKIAMDVKLGAFTPSFWSTMYPTKHEVIMCGDAGYLATHPHGWLGDLYNLRGKTDPVFDSHITRIEWTVAETGRKFVVHHGLFASKLDDQGYLVPEFRRVKFENKKP